MIESGVSLIEAEAESEFLLVVVKGSIDPWASSVLFKGIINKGGVFSIEGGSCN